MNISIIIPCYNEEKRIRKTLRKIIKYLDRQKYNFEIICVDDGSEDKTRKIIQSIKDKRITLTKKRTNRGKGYSVKQGMKKAKYDLALFTDADLSTPIEEIENLVRHHPTHNIVIGTRTNTKKLKIRQPLYRELMGKTFSLLKKTILGITLKDTQCGFKLFDKKGKQLFEKLTIDRFAFDVEIIYLAQKEKLTIKEVPVVWKNNIHTTVNPIKDATKMLLDLFRIRKRH